MDMPDELSGDALVNSLKQLIISIGPHIRDASSKKQAEETLIHLEENDADFHRYDFVKGLNQHIESSLGRILDEELERQSLHPNDSIQGQESVVSRIVDKIRRTLEYDRLTTQLKASVNEAVQNLLQNFETEFNEEETVRRGRGFSRSRKQLQDHFASSDEESSFDDSLNQSSYMFINNEQLTKVAQDLGQKNNLEIRKTALKKLANVATIDFSHYDARTLLRQGLQEALADKDETLARMALKYISRGFSTNNHCTIELYTTLVEHLMMEFKSSKTKVPKLQTGLDCANADNIRLIKCLALMNEYQNTVPHYWVRYSERFLDDILEYTTNLLTIQYSTDLGVPAQISPMHILSLIDPKANWFIRWMHGHYSREPLLKILEKHRNIVDTAVKYVMEYATTRQLQAYDEEPVRESQATATYTGVYTSEEMEFTFVVHSLHLLGRLLCYERGRNFFPVKLRDRDEPVTMCTLLVTLIKLITEPATAASTPRRLSSGNESLDPCQIVTELLKKLCFNELVAAKTMCKDDVTNTLLTPINHLLDGSEDLNTSDTTLLRVADVLAMIASCGVGRQHLLYGEAMERFTKTRSSPAHVLAEFAKKALNDEILSFNNALSKAVIGNFVYVCRQLYNTCEGLVVLYPYDVHSSIAAAWKVANREADNAPTPTPSMSGWESTDRSSQYALMWEDTLRDNLLNFAGTPKGLLMLQQTGAINECVSYMYSRYARKVQVGKCEKFGYGYMLSQVSATAVGMVALLNTGFVSTLSKSLWGVLEVVDDLPVHSPKSWPTSDVDKGARKLFANLINISSSFSAVYEMLGNETLPKKRDYGFRDLPDTIPQLLERLVFIENDNQVHSLFNVEQSHMFGLCLVRVMVCCLDTFLLLQTQYKLQEILLALQAQNVTDESPEIIMDMLSLERNYILVKCYSIGGPTERVIPPRKLPTDRGDSFKFPLFSKYPLPKEYATHHAKSAMKQETDLSKYLADTKKVAPDKDWLGNCRKAFCSVLTTKPDQARGSVLQDLLERVVYFYFKHDPQTSIFPHLEFAGSDSSINKFKLNKMQELGVKMTIKYGIQLKLLTIKPEEAESRLSQLLKKTGYYLQQQQQRDASNSRLLCLKTGYVGFDWFASTVFLMMNGNQDRAWKFLHKFSTLISSAYLWMQRLHSSHHVPQSLMQSGIPVVFSSTCHNVELILQTDLPNVYSAFKVSGYSPAQICQHWIRQCYWNYLDWPEICHYVCVCILLGVDYQVYMCVAILKYLRRSILQKTQEKSLIVFLKEEPLTGFKVGEHLEYMQQLESKFRRTILPDMQNLTKP